MLSRISILAAAICLLSGIGVAAHEVGHSHHDGSTCNHDHDHDHHGHGHLHHDHAHHEHGLHDDHDHGDHGDHDDHDGHVGHAESHSHMHASRELGSPAVTPAAVKPQYPRTALLLTTLSGGAAALGGVLVVIFGTPSPRVLAHLLSFAAGIMLYVSYADLLPHAVSDLDSVIQGDGHSHSHNHDDDHGHGHVHGPGLYAANVWMLGGMILFSIATYFVPDGSDGDAHGHAHGIGAGTTDAHATENSAADGSVTKSHASSTVSKGARQRRGSSSAVARNSSTVALVPSVAANADSAARRRMFKTGLVAALGITLHNLPEGLVVYTMALPGVCDAHAAPAAQGTLSAFFGLPADLSACMSDGLAVAFAIALHNIPEGMAVASPIFAATGSAWQAVYWTAISALAEPLAAVVFGFFFSHLLTPELTAKLNAGVAGIMISLCIGELIPVAATMAPTKVRGQRTGARKAFLHIFVTYTPRKPKPTPPHSHTHRRS